MAVAVTTLSGCAVRSHDITESERKEKAAFDLGRLYENQVAVGDELSLEQSISRAIQYNLDQRVRRVEEALALGQVDLARAGMLPGITASVGYHTRSNDAGGRSQSLLTGEQSLEPSTSLERSRDTSDLQVVWNVLDFGVSYLATRQRQDQVRIAAQRRRQAEAALASDVAEAYHTAWLSQRYGPVLDQLAASIDDQIKNYDALIAEGVRKKESYTRQHQLLDTRTRLRALKKRFATAHVELLQLINAPLGRNVVLRNPRRAPAAPENLAPVDMLERIALSRRPELFDADYRERISVLEARKALLRLFPGLEFSTGRTSDSNRFLFNKAWRDSGIRFGWNLVNIGANIADRRVAKTEAELAILKRQAITVGVLSQIRIAIAKYHVASDELTDRQRQREVLMGLQNTLSLAPESVTPFDLVRANANSVVAAIQTDLAWTELELSRFGILTSIGVDLVEPGHNGGAPKVVGRYLENRLDELMNMYFGIRYPDETS